MANISKFSEDAVNAFASGRIIGGIGIVGVILLVVSIGIIELGLTTPFYADPEFYIVIVLLLSGLVFISISGYLYSRRAEMKHAIYMSVINGYNDAALHFIEKVNAGTVSADNVNELAANHQNKLLEYLKSDNHQCT